MWRHELHNGAVVSGRKIHLTGNTMRRNWRRTFPDTSLSNWNDDETLWLRQPPRWAGGTWLFKFTSEKTKGLHLMSKLLKIHSNSPNWAKWMKQKLKVRSWKALQSWFWVQVDRTRRWTVKVFWSQRHLLARSADYELLKIHKNSPNYAKWMKQKLKDRF